MCLCMFVLHFVGVFGQVCMFGHYCGGGGGVAVCLCACFFFYCALLSVFFSFSLFSVVVVFFRSFMRVFG